MFGPGRLAIKMNNSKKKNSLMHLIATNFYGGPEKQIVEHLKRLDSTKFTGMLASYIENSQQNEILERTQEEGIEHYGIPVNGPFDIRALTDLRTLLTTRKVALLCTHGFKATVIGWLAARTTGVPIISFSRGYTAENRKVAFYEWMERRVLMHVDGVICVSEGQQRKLKSFGIHPMRSWIVHNCVTVDGIEKCNNMEGLRREICTRLDIPENSIIVVSAGRLSPEKGHRYFIEAIAILKERINNVCFILCGDGPCKDDLLSQATQLGVAHLCRFPGFRRDMHEIFKVMDMMVLPSLTEGLPNVVLEAFANAKAVVATAVGGVPEIVEDGINGILVEPAQPASLAKAVERLITMPELCLAMGHAGYKTVALRFTFEQQTQVLKEIYNSLLNRTI